MQAATSTILTLGHSPDPDDAFMFYALAKDLIPTHGFQFQHILQDIQTLNERATRGELDITAVSIHAYAYVSEIGRLVQANHTSFVRLHLILQVFYLKTIRYHSARLYTELALLNY